MNSAAAKEYSGDNSPPTRRYAAKPVQNSPAKSSSRGGKWLILAAAITFVGAGVGMWLMAGPAQSSRTWRPPAPLNSDRAFGFLEAICDIGPRMSGSEGMNRMQELLTQFFEGEGAIVERQEFTVRHPETGEPVVMTNLIVKWFPERKNRILLCTHYDTRPFPDQDPVNPKGLFIGANDGASGPALFQEMAYAMPNLKTKYGVDMVMFDGEEFIFDQQRDKDRYFLGSTYFAQEYVRQWNEANRGGNGRTVPATAPPQYVAGVLVDMIADKELQLYYEVNSYKMAKQVCIDVWSVAQRLRIEEFRARTRHEVRDDHLPLNQIARIPTCDIIDFDYPRPMTNGMSYWHTTQDIPANCSGESMTKVAAVLLEWLRTAK